MLCNIFYIYFADDPDVILKFRHDCGYVILRMLVLVKEPSVTIGGQCGGDNVLMKCMI